MKSLFNKVILWSVPINLALVWWVGHLEASQPDSNSSELEAVGLAALVVLPLLLGIVLPLMFPSNRSKLRGFIRVLTMGITLAYLPVLYWLNINMVFLGGESGGTSNFEVYAAPFLFGMLSIVYFLLCSLVCAVFTNKPLSYSGFD